ncbi:dethiobiotin synthase [Paenibacillus sp. y28]|uniref:dethiobiotin synthase n=1 Tax=Paenibacillus sp. y28 TaxID=3129110 RepID=UPI00301AB655
MEGSLAGRGLFITGTDTDVGKTVVTAGIAAALQRGRFAGEPGAVRLWKPVQTGTLQRTVQGAFALPGPANVAGQVTSALSRRADEVRRSGSSAGTQGRQRLQVQAGALEAAAGGVDRRQAQADALAYAAGETDSARLLRLSGLRHQSAADIATLSLPEPLAPWMAAERAGIRIDYDALVREGQRRLAISSCLLVEGAGGLAVPLTGERLIADLAQQLGLALVIVARPALGTVNHTVLSVEYARKRGLSVAGIILNGFRDGEHDPLAVQENVRMIERFCPGIPVLGVLPWLPEPSAPAAYESAAGGRLPSQSGRDSVSSSDFLRSEDDALRAWREQWAFEVAKCIRLDRLLDRL